MAVHDPITLASLFDGIGGFPYGAVTDREAGIVTVALFQLFIRRNMDLK